MSLAARSIILTLILFGVVDLLGAAWTAWALRAGERKQSGVKATLGRS